MKDHSVAELLEHSRCIASIIPVMGFYLQTAVEGDCCPMNFGVSSWKSKTWLLLRLLLSTVYQTIDVVRAVAGSGRAHEIALYTGNDDNILNDLLTPFDFGSKRIRIVGGLLGHWAIWTKTAVAQQQMVKVASSGSSEILTLGAQVTDANAAVFDAANQFRGCIPGIHEVLRRQSLLAGRWCLDPKEDLSPGQLEEIERVCRSYPHLQDDEFEKEHLDDWRR